MNSTFETERQQAILVDSLSKRYRIGVPGSTTHRQLREDIMGTFSRLIRNGSNSPSKLEREEASTIWALRDLSFTVNKGEIVGIIGRNGSGKSTLLKVLSRITDPTMGRARVHGRVGSLLEIGTGFQPEMTGRENILLNGSILGMRRTEIQRQLDEIIEFSGVAMFIDTPVKYYSSGMYLRLAFAVAAHLDTEVLFIDEILAVGDQEFQRKCLGKMSGVAQEGRTILFVSHNMAAIRTLTRRCIWLDRGQIAADGPTEAVVHAYLTSTEQGASISGETNLSTVARPAQQPPYGPGPFPTAGLRCVKLSLRRPDGQASSIFREGSPAVIELLIEGTVPRTECDVVVTVLTRDRLPLLSLLPGTVRLDPNANCHCLRTVLDPNPLLQGTYTLDVYVQDPYPQDYVVDAIQFDVVREGTESRGRLRYLDDWMVGPMRVRSGWEAVPVSGDPLLTAGNGYDPVPGVTGQAS